MTTSELSHRLHEVFSTEEVEAPDEDEIARLCAEIQQGWSESERRKRYVMQNGRWRPAVVPASVLALANNWQHGFDELPESMPTCAPS
jgi:hypothetical protein